MKFHNKPDYIQYSRKNFEKISNVVIQCPSVKYSIVELLKTLGNKSFNERNYEQAVDSYLNGISIYRYFCPQKKTIIDETALTYESPIQAQETRAFVNVLFLNLTACYLSLKEYDKALHAINESLKIDELNDKAWFRKAKALEGTNDLKNLRSAVDCLELAVRHSKNEKDQSYFRSRAQELNDKYAKIRKGELLIKSLADPSPMFSNTDSQNLEKSQTSTHAENTRNREKGGITASNQSNISK